MSSNHRRPSVSRRDAAGTAAALVVGWLAVAVFLNSLLLRLQQNLGTVGAYAALICLAMLAAAGWVVLGRRYAALDEPDEPEDGHRCTADAVEHAVTAVDAQVATLVRAGVEEEAARTLVREQLVRAITPRQGGGHTVEDLLRRAAEGAQAGEQPRTAGQYL